MPVHNDPRALVALWRDEQNEKHRRTIARRDAQERERYELWINDEELQQRLREEQEAEEAKLIAELEAAFEIRKAEDNA